MLSTYGDIKTEFLVKMNVTTTAAYYTDAIIDQFAREAYMQLASLHKWPMTEAIDTSQTWTSATETYNYSSLTKKFKSNSIRFMQVASGGINYRFQKLNFEDYQIFREEQNTANDRIWSEFGRVIYVNPYAVLINGATSGTMSLFGQQNLTPIDVTDPTATTIFSNGEEEANEAIVYEMMAYAYMKEKQLNLAVKKGAGVLVGEAAAYHFRAMEIIEGVWKRITEEKFAFHGKNRGIFKRIDILRGAARDDIFKRDQFY